jgi:hypothetical protein
VHFWSEQRVFLGQEKKKGGDIYKFVEILSHIHGLIFLR